MTTTTSYYLSQKYCNAVVIQLCHMSHDKRLPLFTSNKSAAVHCAWEHSFMLGNILVRSRISFGAVIFPE